MSKPWLVFSACLIGGAALIASAMVRAYSSAPPAQNHDVITPVALPAWEADNPLVPLPKPPLGLDRTFEELPDPPQPPRVRLGRWLFFDKRLSLDGTVSCATCHRSEHGFSEPFAVSTGVGGKLGVRKAPPLLNLAWSIFPHFFWDGRAASLEEQAMGPIDNPIEMGGTHEQMVQRLTGASAYAPYFRQAFGDDRITASRVAKAIADYERTRLSGNSPWDRWQAGNESAVGDAVKKGHNLFFFGKAACNQCHLGPNFTDSAFHNLGVGWKAAERAFKDDGRYAITKNDEDRGAFKTPTLRDIATHAPYMHDGSQKTLREVVEWYNRGGEANPHLDPRMRPLNLSPEEIDQVVAFLEALSGEGYTDQGPQKFPR